MPYPTTYFDSYFTLSPMYTLAWVRDLANDNVFYTPGGPTMLGSSCDNDSEALHLGEAPHFTPNEIRSETV